MLLNVAALSLGLLGLETQIQGASARPYAPNGRTGHSKRQGITLSESSSCNDVSNYQTENGLVRIQADMYDMLEVHKVLDEYLLLSDDPDQVMDSYVSGFAAPWGVGQTYACLIPDTCPRINCADLQDPDAPGSGPAYAALISFSNVNNYLQALWESLNLSKDDWNGVQVKVQQTYYPYDAPPIILRELVNGLQAFVGVIGASSGIIGAGTAATVGSAAAMLSGVLGGINLAISDTDESLQNLAELEANTQAWYQILFTNFVWMNNNLTETGFYVDSELDVAAGLADIVAGGAWLDYTDHPVLNDDQGKPQVSIDAMKQAFYYYLLANMVNFAWKKQGTFIVKYEMSEDDFNAKGNDWTPGNGDFRFRTWADGSAYFLQRYTGDQDPLRELPMSAYPPGWGEVATDLSCDTGCIMRSAAAGFNAHGYNFNFTTDAADYTSDQATAMGWLTDLPSAPGFFNIPVVDLTGNDGAEDADALNEILLNENFSYGEDQKKTLWCYVQDFTDMNGVKFVDQFDSELVEEFWNNCNLGFD